VINVTLPREVASDDHINLAVQRSRRLTYILLRFIYFSRPLISELAERNSTKIGHMVGIKCDLKTHDRNLGYPLFLQIGAQKPTFWRLRNLTTTLTAYIFTVKQNRYNQPDKCITNYKASATSSQSNMNFGP